MKRLAVWTAALLFATALLAADDAALLPADGFAAGWAREGAARVYRGEALYDHIDGGGEIFLEMGFGTCTVHRYRKGTETLAIEIYRMADPAAALGIYLASCGRETPSAAYPERHTVGRNQILCVKGPYYLVATSQEATPGLASVLVAAAKAVTDRIASAEAPAVLKLLPGDGLVPNSVRIVRGPIGLQAIVTLGEGDILQLERKATAVVGDYRERDGKTETRLVAEYPSSEAALQALRNLTQKLDPTLSRVSAGEAALLFKDRQGRYGSAAIEGARLTIRWGLAGAP